MAARDGTFRDGLYHFQCEACGADATARRSHARTCSSACAARLRRGRTALPGRRRNERGKDRTEFRFYISRRKLETSLSVLAEGTPTAPELIVGFDREEHGPELARLVIEMTDHDDGGLVCSVTAPYDPFEAAKRSTRRAEPS
jgi:hypothetical protein